MEIIFADNEEYIKHMCSMISIHNSEGHLHMFDKDTIAKAVFDMSLYLDFKYLQCDVLSNMISTYCLDAYASQLSDYEDKRIEKYYVAWRKAMRKIWKLPNLTHCNLLPVITNCLP